MFNYPLNFKFKAIALASKITVTDASGKQLFYVKQKAFKLKENIQLFTDDSMQQQIGTIGTDKVFDFSPTFRFKTMDGTEIGSVKRHGRRSIFKATYEVMGTDSEPDFVIREEKGWVKFVDALIGEIPILGMFAGYMFNPVYIVQRGNINTPKDAPAVLRIVKKPAMLEGKFDVELVDKSISDEEESRLVIGALVSVMLERFRG